VTTARIRSAILSFALPVAWASGASAQPAVKSLEDLKALGAARTVTVVDDRSNQFQGTIADASESRLVLRTLGRMREFQAADVREVRVRKDDSLKNGAVIGAAVGGGLTSLAFLDNECHDDPACYKAVVVYAGLGALAGAAIDALIHGTTVLYHAPPRSDRLLTLAPMTGAGRRGIAVMVRF